MNQLHELGFQLKNVRNLQTKHIRVLIGFWKDAGLSSGTIKNRVADLRWLAEKIDKPYIVNASNDFYGIERRQYVKNDANIAKSLTVGDLNKVTCQFVRFSLQLQAAFGLRREESIKFRVKMADKGAYVLLQATWCKGGRERIIPVRNEEQRRLLDAVAEFCRQKGCVSLIPKEKTYYQQMRSYQYQTEISGIDRNHGLRHQYAQQRYRELTGFEPPKCGGRTKRELSAEERLRDYQARMTISNELGHNREEVTAVYLGR